MTRKANNPMTGSDFDGMVLNQAVWGSKAPVKASVSGVSLVQLSPFFASILPLFPQKRLILRLPSAYHKSSIDPPPPLGSLFISSLFEGELNRDGGLILVASHAGVFRGARISSLPTNACSTKDNTPFPLLYSRGK